MGNIRHGGLIKLTKDTRIGIAQKYGANTSRSLQVTGASGIANIFIGLGKLGAGLLSMSLFTCMSALYTFCMVIAKYCALTGILKSPSIKVQYRYYTLSGLVLMAASILYIAYSVRLFYYPVTAVYNEYVAMAIAAFTFTELTLNIRGVIITRNNHDPLIHAIKMINLASSLICLVLTQTAILSFASAEVDMHPAADGFFGMIMGGMATLLGAFMIFRIKRIEKGKNYGSIFRKVKKLIKQENILVKLKPYYFKETEKGTVLYVKYNEAATKKSFLLLKQKAKEELNIYLLEADSALINKIGGKADD